jgi:SMC interacting uncharacterized protein involved in chromosome segregation
MAYHARDGDDKDTDDYFENMRSSGLKIHEEIEKLSKNELKKSMSECVRLVFECMEDVERIQQLLESSFKDITVDSRQRINDNMDAAKELNITAPDDLIEVAVASYRDKFKLLMEPFPRLREKCLQFSRELKGELTNLRRRNRDRSPLPLEVELVEGCDRNESTSSQGASKKQKSVSDR